MLIIIIVLSLILLAIKLTCAYLEYIHNYGYMYYLLPRLLRHTYEIPYTSIIDIIMIFVIIIILRIIFIIY